MVQIDIEYQGSLRCEAVHAPSGSRLITDAPVDNHGKGESFSPTDLVATALASCIVTTMAIFAERHDWDLTGTRARVEKHMVADPERRIGELTVVVSVPHEFDEKTRRALEKVGMTCPVHRTIGDDTKMPVRFEWGA